ncbi:MULTISPECIES: DUF3159 domain-containing protein [Subtercola]|uniref:DUF3159 domain-containing protein n=1 Tax=Subtercola vilae TaxID=2056433 RepID=A0A4T2C8U5_9MICO|nr:MULTISPECIES: DUF3159 domain-containing protein [Subtercola]MEA9984810.1 DUF3159 domain-containing protein [Subtercola sp. RTI3]TIH39841.1 DUF3159 domain-containing protein [Subtercola vilae]
MSGAEQPQGGQAPNEQHGGAGRGNRQQQSEHQGSGHPVPNEAKAAQRVNGADESEAPLSFSAAFAAAAKRSGIGQVAPGEAPTVSSLLRAIGGVRGLIESILPGLAFLVIYTLTKDLTPSVIAPLAVAAVFIVVRLVTRSPVMPAIAGLIGVAVSAGLALFTGRAEDNFVVGIVINAVSVVVLLGSIVARWPLIGLIVGVLTGDAAAWKSDAAKFKVVLIATWCWVGLFALRLAVEVPLYLAGQAEALASVKLILGVPLYAGMLWVTWLLVRAAFGHEGSKTVPEPSDPASPTP